MEIESISIVAAAWLYFMFDSVLSKCKTLNTIYISHTQWAFRFGAKNAFTITNLFEPHKSTPLFTQML